MRSWEGQMIWRRRRRFFAVSNNSYSISVGALLSCHGMLLVVGSGVAESVQQRQQVFGVARKLEFDAAASLRESSRDLALAAGRVQLDHRPDSPQDMD